MPTWVAPNLITMVGLFFPLSSFALTAWMNPTLSEPCAAWVYVVCGAFLFIYQTMDNLDGLQARRTGITRVLLIILFIFYCCTCCDGGNRLLTLHRV